MPPQTVDNAAAEIYNTFKLIYRQFVTILSLNKTMEA